MGGKGGIAFAVAGNPDTKPSRGDRDAIGHPRLFGHAVAARCIAGNTLFH
jgi:hypothetical protein